MCIKTKQGRTTYADLSEVKWDAYTRYDEVLFNEFLREQNKELYAHIEAIKAGGSIGKDVLSTVQAKPGLFGFSVDLRALGSTLQRWFKTRRRNSR